MLTGRPKTHQQQTVRVYWPIDDWFNNSCVRAYFISVVLVPKWTWWAFALRTSWCLLGPFRSCCEMYEGMYYIICGGFQQNGRNGTGEWTPKSHERGCLYQKQVNEGTSISGLKYACINQNRKMRWLYVPKPDVRPASRCEAVGWAVYDIKFFFQD